MTTTSAPVQKFLAANAAEVDYCHSQFLEFTSRHNGQRFAMFVKENGGMERAYRIDRSGSFGPEVTSLARLGERVVS